MINREGAGMNNGKKEPGNRKKDPGIGKKEPGAHEMEMSEKEKLESFPKAASKEESRLDPYEINFLPEFREGRGPEEPFINEYGVIIGDHMYQSPNSPLENWSTDTDPEIMSGDQWVHPFKDIGFLTTENREYFEQGIPPQGAQFMHPDKDVAYAATLKEDARGNAGGERQNGERGEREELEDDVR
jgi:hypothetical protein